MYTLYIYIYITYIIYKYMLAPPRKKKKQTMFLSPGATPFDFAMRQRQML